MEVGQNLARMAEVGQTVDDRNGAVLRQILYFLLRVGADHDAVQIAAQNAGGILYRLAAADLKVTVGQEQRLTAQLIHASLEGNTGTGGGLLEDHAKALVAEQVRIITVNLDGLLHCQAKILDSQDLLFGEVVGVDEILRQRHVDSFPPVVPTIAMRRSNITPRVDKTIIHPYAIFT